MWDRLASHARLSWANSRLTVINANDSLCQHYGPADAFLRSEMEQKKINFEQGLKLVEVKKVILILFRRNKLPYSRTCQLDKWKKDPIKTSIP